MSLRRHDAAPLWHYPGNLTQGLPAYKHHVRRLLHVTFSLAPLSFQQKDEMSNKLLDQNRSSVRLVHP